MIDIIGTIHKPTGVILQDSEGNDYPEQAPIPGYHVNATEPQEGWEAYLVTPTTPIRVFAGLEPVCYTFPDKATLEGLYDADSVL